MEQGRKRQDSIVDRTKERRAVTFTVILAESQVWLVKQWGGLKCAFPSVHFDWYSTPDSLFERL